MDKTNSLNVDAHESEEDNCLLRVLNVKDRARFIELMPDDWVDHCNRTRSIRTEDWLAILRKCQLETTYSIYRKAYWGECAGIEKIVPEKSPSKVVLITTINAKQLPESIDSHHPHSSFLNPLRQLFTGSWDSISPFGTGAKRICLLIENNQVSVLDRVSTAGWWNRAYTLNNSEDELLWFENASKVKSE